MAQDPLQQKTQELISAIKEGRVTDRAAANATLQQMVGRLRDRQAQAPPTDEAGKLLKARAADVFSKPMDDSEEIQNAGGPTAQPRSDWSRLASGEQDLGFFAMTQLNLGMHAGQNALGSGITQLSDIPGRMTSLITGTPFDAEQEHQTGAYRALAALGKWVGGDPVQDNEREHETFISKTMEQVGGSLPMIASTLAGPEAPIIMGGLQAGGSGLERGQNAQAQARAMGVQAPTDAQVAIMGLVSAGAGAGVGKLLSVGAGQGSLLGQAMIPAAGNALQQHVTDEAGRKYLGEEGPSLSKDAEAAIGGAAFGVVAHAMNPHPVQPDSAPGLGPIEVDPSASSLNPTLRYRGMQENEAQSALSTKPDTTGLGDMLNRDPEQRAVNRGNTEALSTKPDTTGLNPLWELAKPTKDEDLSAIVDHLRSLSPNTETGLARTSADAAPKQDYTGPVEHADIQAAMWAADPNLADIAKRHEITSSPQMKLQARQELEDTLRRHLTNEEVSGIAKWSTWAQDNAESLRLAREAVNPKPVEEAAAQGPPPSLESFSMADPIVDGERGTGNRLPVDEASHTGQYASMDEAIAIRNILPAADDPQALGDWHDIWVADRDEGLVGARIRGANHEEELNALLPKRDAFQVLADAARTGTRFSPQFQDLAHAITFNIELRDIAPEEARSLEPRLLPEDRRILELARNLPDGARALADKIVAENAEQGKEAESIGVIGKARENYIARILKPLEEDQTPGDSRAKFATTTGRFKARTYPSLLHALADGRELAVTSAIDAQRIASEQVYQSIADRKLINLGLKAGLFNRYGVTAQPESDTSASMNPADGPWTKIEHPNFVERVPRTVNGETVWEPQGLYAPKETADRLNALLGKSVLNNSDFLRFNKKIHGTNLELKVDLMQATKAANNMMKESMLFYSFFHHIAMTTAHVFGSADIIKSMNPVSAYRQGMEMLRHPDSQLTELVRKGMTLGRKQDYEVQRLADGVQSKRLVDMLPVSQGAKNVLHSVIDQQHDFLFHRFMPALKMYSAQLELNDALLRNKDKLLDGSISRDEIVRGVATTLNNRFQSQNLMRQETVLGIRRTATNQDIARLALLAPDWTESVARFHIQGFKPGFEGDLARRTWARIITRSLAATGLANIAMSALDDRSFKQRFVDAYNSKEGVGGVVQSLFGIDVTPVYHFFGGKEKTKYISMLNQYRDGFSLLDRGLGDEFKAKASPLARAVWNAGAGTDWAGRPFTSTGELLGLDNKGVYSTTGVQGGKAHFAGEPMGGQLVGQRSSRASAMKPGPLSLGQVPSYAFDTGLGFLPLEMQNAISWMSGQQDGFDALTKSFGFRESSSDPESTMKWQIEDQRRHAQSLSDKKAAELNLKAFNAAAKAKKMSGH